MGERLEAAHPLGGRRCRRRRRRRRVRLRRRLFGAGDRPAHLAGDGFLCWFVCLFVCFFTGAPRAAVFVLARVFKVLRVRSKSHWISSTDAGRTDQLMAFCKCVLDKIKDGTTTGDTMAVTSPRFVVHLLLTSVGVRECRQSRRCLGFFWRRRRRRRRRRQRRRRWR